MKVSIYLLCYNEKIYLPITVSYYKSQFPNAKITILDNYSEDNSVEIAKMLGCNVSNWHYSDDGRCENKDGTIPPKSIRNRFWTDEEDNTWIITHDMDEFLCINDIQLEYEDKVGTTIILTNGYNMIGNSQKLDLSDVNLYEISTGYRNTLFDKRVCFKKGPIKKMNFIGTGQHVCKPDGNIVYSKEIYYHHHLKYISDKYLVNRYLNVYKPAEKNSPNKHYQYKNEEEVLRHLSSYKKIDNPGNLLQLKPLSYYMRDKIDYKNIKLPSIIYTGGKKLTKKKLTKSKLNKLKVTEIKLLLKKKNLPTYGNKDILITRYLKK